MRSFGWLAVAVSLWVVPGAGYGEDRLAEVVERVSPSIVAVGTVAPMRQPRARFLGTGFAVLDGHHVLTNHHVLPERIKKGETKAHLAVFSGRGRDANARRAEVVQVDPGHDLAVLRIQGAALAPMRLGDSGRVRAGETYAFTGFPIGMVLGLHPVTHKGIISSVTPIAIPMHSSRNLNPEIIRRLNDPYKVFQLDATAYPGNSGSPLYSPATGSVMGIVNMVFVKESKEAVLEKPSGITYAIPISHAKALLEKME